MEVWAIVGLLTVMWITVTIHTNSRMANERMSVEKNLNNTRYNQAGTWAGEIFKFHDGDIVEFKDPHTREFTAPLYKNHVVISAVVLVNGVEREVPVASLRKRSIKPVDPTEWEGVLKKYPSHRGALVAPESHLQYLARISAGTYTVKVLVVKDQDIDRDGNPVEFDRQINILIPEKKWGCSRNRVALEIMQPCRWESCSTQPDDGRTKKEVWKWRSGNISSSLINTVLQL